MPSTNATRLLLDSLAAAVAELPAGLWGVGYSGGRDSAVLLWGLAQLTDPSRLRALHVDHGWRPAQERASEAALVEGWCRLLGVSLTALAPPPIGAPHTEAAARAHRYRCFQSFVDEHPGSPVFLAHHADDQAETVLMRLLKGRSWQGLGGMRARRGPYLRPLLGLRASVLAEVAAIEGIPFHQDTTNSDPSFSRNFLRSQVFPLVTDRFPRAVEALNEFAQIWVAVAPSATVDPRWTLSGGGGIVSVSVWDQWSDLSRQAQLLAVANVLAGETRLSRRFLESLTKAGRRGTAAGAGWTWSRAEDTVRWEKVVQPVLKEYFVVAEAETVYSVGAYRFCWKPATGELPAGWLAVPGIDPSAPLVWRSAASGMRFSSENLPDWGKQRRRKRLGSTSPDRCALLVQGGWLRAAVDPAGNRLLWSETPPGKLHKNGIFVKLDKRSDYERR